MAGETVRLAEFCSNLRYEGLPPKVVEKAKSTLLDTLGVAIAGHETESSRIVIGLVRDMAGVPDATVIGEAAKVPMANAALANGAMVHAVELDDTHRWTYLHAGSFIIPAALAVAERMGLGGKELLTAIVAGYEVAIRLALAVNPSHRRRGFHTTGTVGAVGAAAAASRAMGLDPETTASALGIGGSQSAGLFEFLAEGAMTKRFHPGRSAQSGIYAAMMARAGFVGPRTILEGTDGFCRAMSDEPDISWLNRGLGSEFKILEMGVKPYASCRFCHSSIDAAQEILDRTGVLRPEQIELIEDLVSPLNAMQTGDLAPTTFMGAQMSTPYSIGLVLSGRGAGFDQYLAGLEDERVAGIAGKVRMTPRADFGETSRRVEMRLHLADGRSFASTVELPTGEPERPLDAEGMKRKFMGLASTAIEEDRAEQIADCIEAIETTESVAGLCGLLAAPASR